jgi:hypothetical protein
LKATGASQRPSSRPRSGGGAAAAGGGRGADAAGWQAAGRPAASMLVVAAAAAAAVLAQRGAPASIHNGRCAASPSLHIRGLCQTVPGSVSARRRAPRGLDWPPPPCPSCRLIRMFCSSGARIERTYGGGGTRLGSEYGMMWAVPHWTPCAFEVCLRQSLAEAGSACAALDAMRCH